MSRDEGDRSAEVPHPRETAGLSGHVGAERELLEAYRSGRLHHAWLIGGPRGIGKATLAWRFARFLLAVPDPRSELARRATTLAVAPDHPVATQVSRGSAADVVALRRTRNEKTGKLYTEIRIDEVRAATGLFQRAAGAGGWRVCIIDSAEDLNRSSANALLKLVEEPPARAVFLILAHQPSRVMPTLLSRCRKLFLPPLSDTEVAHALDALPPAGPAPAPEDRQAAIARAGGSVGRALALLDPDRLALDREIARELDRLPVVDGRALHRLADRLAAAERDGEAVAELLGAALLDWLDAALHRGAAEGVPARNLAPLAEVWDKLHASIREAEALNLDKRPLILSLFAALAEATASPRRF